MSPAVLVELLPLFGPLEVRLTRRAGSATGRRSSRTWSVIENIAVLAPIPRAREMMATSETIGVLSRRSGWRTSGSSILLSKDEDYRETVLINFAPITRLKTVMKGCMRKGFSGSRTS